jgi:predicted amidohydrolase
LAKKIQPRRQRTGEDKTVHVGLTQFAAVPEARVNRNRQMKMIELAARQGAQVICTQEMCTSQYFCQAEDHRFFSLAESIPGPTTDAACKLARKHKVVIIASLFERRASGLYHNTAAVIDADGSLLGTYRKISDPHMQRLMIMYRSAMKTIKDNVTSMQGRTGKYFARDTIDNPSYALLY